MRYTFTVFTPTFNRAHTLHRVYESLKAQTFRDFEWLIVDDGSTDDTLQMVEDWQEEGHFPIRFYWQENQGKHIAFNRGVQEAQGEFFLTLDSDDACVPKALERFKFHWDNIPPMQKMHFSAVTALCQDQHGNIVGDKFPENILDSDSIEIRYRYKVKGEKWGFHRTEVLREYPFPKLTTSSFIPEGIVWSAIARTFKTRFINEALRIYHMEPMNSDQLTRICDPLKYAPAHALWRLSQLNNEIAWFWANPGEFLRATVHYVRFSFHCGIGARKQLTQLETRLGKIIWAAAWPLGFIVHLKDKSIDRMSTQALFIA